MAPMANRVKELRLEAGMSQEALARGAEVSLATIRRCDRGEMPNVRTAQAVARTLGVTVDDLFPEPQEATA